MSLCTTDQVLVKTTATSVVADIVRIVRRLNDGTVGKDFNEYSRDLVLANPEDKAIITQLGSKRSGLWKLVEIFNAQDISSSKSSDLRGWQGACSDYHHKINKAQLGNVSASWPSFRIWPLEYLQGVRRIKWRYVPATSANIKPGFEFLSV